LLVVKLLASIGGASVRQNATTLRKVGFRCIVQCLVS
jgi:hypothetical protein